MELSTEQGQEWGQRQNRAVPELGVSVGTAGMGQG